MFSGVLFFFKVIKVVVVVDVVCTTTTRVHYNCEPSHRPNEETLRGSIIEANENKKMLEEEQNNNK